MQTQSLCQIDALDHFTIPFLLHKLCDFKIGCLCTNALVGDKKKLKGELINVIMATLFL